ncbi:MAG: thioredoxin domain-containing protein [Pseudomonadota bacterium]
MAENRLAGETSPYLLQHKDNPVDWHPWGSEALETARREQKAILLSVGYAACHWCHVMAHESFENEDIANLMNELFVNIKVDREERPDLDTIYQTALALLGEHGGWPLTMFLTPDGEPFWGGTYFPPEPRFGRPGFPQVLQGIAAAYRDDPAKVSNNVTALKDALKRLSTTTGGGAVTSDILGQVAQRLVREIDPATGGIGGAPKFPNPTMLKLLWRAWKRTKDETYRHAVELTLSAMCQGGIYDHLGGGFARYTVDDKWLVPHFEKMLYDNAQLIDLLTWAWQDSGNPLYETRARETVAWVAREMMAAAGDGESAGTCGAFASSLDADSEGEEGKFYVWNEGEIDRLLGDRSASFKASYDVSSQGNWEGKVILNRSQRPQLGDEALEADLAGQRQTLFDERVKRIPPGWDDKVLADWNGLMIAALARAAPVFGEPSWLAMAETAFRFVVEQMTVDGRLRHSWRHGKLQHPATLDDYANLSDGALALYEATWDQRYLDQVEAWLEVVERHYADSGGGGYFFTADDTEGLIVRTKTANDSAVPAGNGTLAAVLARLYYLTGESKYRERAEALISAFSGELGRNIFPLSTLLNASETLSSAVQVVVVSANGPNGTKALLGALRGQCLPDQVLQVVDSADALAEGHPAKGKTAKDGQATAYVCRGQSCSLPITDPAELVQALTL